ncbi:phosphoglycerate mutase-like protein [Violaceomyces palustris]|uniref:Phosphoglycerate mutase-like protein n=1 Tax=Violaceomyces palustris TaxID=1673888 RepID=A0ACD0NNB4_9BASI|nr:phosphoglycerate mutase-like protein [Violaceomyces palustris]
MNWSANEVFAPTGRPRDPVLTAHGLDQARDLASYLCSLPPSERPELIISSPYYRCLQTSIPSHESLRVPLVVEPGLAEWFPTAPPETGLHPSPARAETMREWFPTLSLSWEPLLYPSNRGEDVAELHQRARRCLELIEKRCQALGLQRVLLVSHAATLIALGRALLEDDLKRTIQIGTGTASLSKYTRRINDGVVGSVWKQELNGDASFLRKGVEREWSFEHVPDNVSEPGMGQGWFDEEAPSLSEPESSGMGADRSSTSGLTPKM